jgi:hypothetical protein
VSFYDAVNGAKEAGNVWEGMNLSLQPDWGGSVSAISSPETIDL